MARRVIPLSLKVVLATIEWENGVECYAARDEDELHRKVCASWIEVRLAASGIPSNHMLAIARYIGQGNWQLAVRRYFAHTAVPGSSRSEKLTLHEDVVSAA